MTTRLVGSANMGTWPSPADNPMIHTTFRQLNHVWAARLPPAIVLVLCYFHMSRHTPRDGRNDSPKESISWRFVQRTAILRKLLPGLRDSFCMRL